MAFCEPGEELPHEGALKHALEPRDVEVDEFGEDEGQPEDGVFAEEGCGRAPESSHLGDGGRVPCEGAKDKYGDSGFARETAL